MTTTESRTAGWLPVASCPLVQRELYLSRALRRREDEPLSVESLSVKWSDMEVAFAEAAGHSPATVQVHEEISLAVFGRRMESLLDCAAATNADSRQWVLKLCLKASTYGGADESIRALCDKVVERTTDGATVGVMKLKRRSVARGHATVRIDPQADAIQIVMRHPTAEGLKALWKSVLWRLHPQYPKAGGGKSAATPVRVNAGVTVLAPPSIRIQVPYYSWTEGAAVAGAYGVAVDVAHAKMNGIDVHVPIPASPEPKLTRQHVTYSVRLEVRSLPPGKPASVVLLPDGELQIFGPDYAPFAAAVTELEEWLGIRFGGSSNVPATGLRVKAKTPTTGRGKRRTY